MFSFQQKAQWKLLPTQILQTKTLTSNILLFPLWNAHVPPFPPSHVTLDNMKFPKPRTLLQNVYPDLIISQPDIFKDMVNNFNKPPINSEMDTYIDASIQHLKSLHKAKQSKLKVNNLSVSSRLSYAYITIPPSTTKIKCLIDTGCSNTIIHSSVAK